MAERDADMDAAIAAGRYARQHSIDELHVHVNAHFEYSYKCFCR